MTEALLPIVRDELEALVAAGCREITVDEPSMSCYAHREDPSASSTSSTARSSRSSARCRLSTHLCFGNYKGRAVGPRRYAPMFPAFLDLTVDEIHVEMASREFAELEVIGHDRRAHDVAVGIIDVKSYYVETPEDVAERVRAASKHAPAERLAFAPDCGLSPDGALGGRQKLANMVAGVEQVREELGDDGEMIQPAQRDDDVARRRRRRSAPATTTCACGGSARAASSCSGRTPPPARSLPLRLADGEVRRDRQAARADDGARRRSASGSTSSTSSRRATTTPTTSTPRRCGRCSPPTRRCRW